MNPFKTLVYTTAAASIAMAASAADLKQSRFTQVINDVKVIAMSDKSQKAASVNEIFKLPDVIRTGLSSRAELVAEDKTITRVGANTIFSFDPSNRTINLEQGSLLFHSPKGKGGGTVRSGSATAAVLGTTIMVSTTSDGGFKVLVLEGTAKVKLNNGKTVFLNAGEMVFVLPGGDLSPVTPFRLDTLVAGSKLVNGFDSQLPSLRLIEQAINGQEAQIASGEAADTGLLIGDVGTVTGVQTIDVNNWPQETLDIVRDRLGDIVNEVLSPGALNDDLIVDSSTVPQSHIFATPTTVGGLPISGPFTGAFGRNIIFTSGAEVVNLTPYASLPVFTFLASQNINFQSSVEFSVDAESQPILALNAPNGTITIAYDSSVSYSGPGLSFESGQTMSFDTVYLNNNQGFISLDSQMGLTLKDSQVNGFGINLAATGDVNLSGTTLNGSGFQPQVLAANKQSIRVLPRGPIGNVSVVSRGGSIRMTSCDVSGLGVNVVAAGNVNLDNTYLSSSGQILAGAKRQSSRAVLPGHVNVVARLGSINMNNGAVYGDQLSMHAAQQIGINGTYLANLSSINMSAHTIVLENVNFGYGSTVLLSSLNGVLAPNPNTGAKVVYGDVNFRNNVTYGEDPAQFWVNPTGNFGIFISKNGQSTTSRVSSKGPRQLTMRLTGKRNH